jgi:hypothetical protein
MEKAHCAFSCAFFPRKVGAEKQRPSRQVIDFIEKPTGHFAPVHPEIRLLTEGL